MASKQQAGESSSESMESEMGNIKVACRNLWKIFGDDPKRLLADLQESGDNLSDSSKGNLLAETGHVIAVRDVSFDVMTGETFVVMGLSGSGKSTLLRCLPRLIEPTDGAVFVDGHNIEALNNRDLREMRRHTMSMVFQHFGLFPHRTIIDNVAYGLEVQGIDRDARYQTAGQVLEQVNLSGWENHYPGQLSGGMQQRVGLARALAVDPEIMLFDEPFSALDPLIRREMQDELLELQREMRKTLIFITHDFAEAIKIGTHIAIMKDGKFVQVDTPEAIILNPANDYVAEFTRDVPRTNVVTARAIMQPINGSVVGRRSIQASSTLNEFIDLAAETDDLLCVVDERGDPIGQISGRNLLRALSTGGDSP